MRADVLFIGAQSAIRADGFFVRAGLGKTWQDLRAARANRVFCTDEKHIGTENTVMDKCKGGLVWLFYKIATPQQRGAI